jgi:hypothetical protein
MVNSETYQRSSRPHAGNDADVELFSHAAVRVLVPEQLYDSLVAVLGNAREAPGKGGKKVAAKKNVGGPREQFISFFRIEEGADPTEYQAGIPQALRLMNSPQTNNNAAVVTQAMKAGSPAKGVEYLYLGALSRRPTEAESERMTRYIGQQDSPRTAYGDILWVLLNSSEFALNR